MLYRCFSVGMTAAVGDGRSCETGSCGNVKNRTIKMMVRTRYLIFLRCDIIRDLVADESER